MAGVERDVEEGGDWYVARRKNDGAAAGSGKGSFKRAMMIGAAADHEEERKEADEADAANGGISASVDQLAELIDKAGGGEQWKSQTQGLVDTISAEINRILAYDDDDVQQRDPSGDADDPLAENERESNREALSETTPSVERAQEQAETEAEAATKAKPAAADLGAGAAEDSAPQAETNLAPQAETKAVAQDKELGQQEQEEQEQEEQEQEEDVPACDEQELESLLGYMSDPDDEQQRPEASRPGDRPHESQIAATKLTPFQVWKRAHVQAPSAPRRKLTKKEIDTMVSRLGAYQQSKELATMQMQHAILREQLSSLTFRPRLCKRSLSMSKAKPLQQRLAAVLAHKQQRLAAERERLMAEEQAECPLKPTITTKPIKWTPRTRCDILLAHRAEEAAEQDAELTFEPKLNKRSCQMAEQAARRGTRRTVFDTTTRRRTGAPGHKAAYQEPVFSHQPKINARSRALQRADPAENVHDRLHSRGLQQPKKRPASASVGIAVACARNRSSSIGSIGPAAPPAAPAAADAVNSARQQPLPTSTVCFDKVKHAFLLRRVHG